MHRKISRLRGKERPSARNDGIYGSPACACKTLTGTQTRRVYFKPGADCRYDAPSSSSALKEQSPLGCNGAPGGALLSQREGSASRAPNLERTRRDIPKP
jgi:hypothetical protein